MNGYYQKDSEGGELRCNTRRWNRAQCP